MRKVLVVSLGLGLTASLASGATIVLNPSSTTVDDVQLQYGTTPWTNNAGTDGNFVDGSTGGLLGYANLFTDVPLTSGGNPIVIDSATLTITTNMAASTPVSVYRVTNPWLTLPAGTNEMNINGHFRDITGAVEWATNPGWNQTFGGSDYDAGSVSIGTVLSGDYNAVTTFDVTNVVSSLFASGVDQGFFVTVPGTGYIRSSEYASPEMTINYHYVPEPGSLSLVVVGGLGLLSRRRHRA